MRVIEVLEQLPCHEVWHGDVDIAAVAITRVVRVLLLVKRVLLKSLLFQGSAHRYLPVEFSCVGPLVVLNGQASVPLSH